MKNLDLLKVALEEGVKVLPTHFLQDNNIKAKYLGDKYYDQTNDDVCVYVIEEEGEFKDKVVYQYKKIW